MLATIESSIIFICRSGIVECLLTLKRLHENELKDLETEISTPQQDRLKTPIAHSPVQTKDMKPFLGPASRRDKSPLRRSPSLASPPEPQNHVVEHRNRVLTPNLNFEAMADGLLRHTGIAIIFFWWRIKHHFGKITESFLSVGWFGPNSLAFGVISRPSEPWGSMLQRGRIWSKQLWNVNKHTNRLDNLKWANLLARLKLNTVQLGQYELFTAFPNLLRLFAKTLIVVYIFSL